MKDSAFTKFIKALGWLFVLVLGGAYFFYKHKEKIISIWRELEKKVEEYEPKLEQFEAELPQKIKQVERELKPLKKKVVRTLQNLDNRQEAILKLIKKNSKISMKHLAKEIEGVSDRTLRRDLLKLEQKGVIKQSGKTKDSVYTAV